MKTISTLFISIITLVSTVNANEINSNLEITSTTVVSGTNLIIGTNDNTVILKWSAKNQVSNSRFEIERSFYSNNFNTIATLQTSFTNSGNNNYRISDNAAELAGRSIAYYRVKQIDDNGTTTYSNVMVVNLKDANNNNATTQDTIKKNTIIRFSASQNGNAVIRLQTITGQTVTVKNSIISKGNNAIELENMGSLKKGIYVTEVSVNGVVIDNQKIIAE